VKSSELRQYLDQLGAAAGFTHQQLESNRGGNLHPDQLRRAGRGLGAAVALLLIGLGALVGGLSAAKALAGAGTAIAVGAGGVVVGLGCALFAGLRLRTRARRLAPFAGGRALAVEGLLTKTQADGGFRVEVQGHAFPVSKPAYDVLTHGASFRLYYVGDQLLSLEPVGVSR